MSTGNLGDFDARTVEPTSFDVLPAGEYEACITASSVEQTKKGDGRYLAMELQILSGPAKGRKLFDRLNLWNPSPKAVEIARGTLSSICRAVGVLTPQDSSDLHDKPLMVKVVVTNDSQYGDRNEIKAYRPAKTTTGAPPLADGSKYTEPLPPRGQPAPDDSLPF